MRFDSARDLWSPVLNSGENIDIMNSFRGIARYKSPKKLLLDYIEDGSDRVWAGRRTAALDVG